MSLNWRQRHGISSWDIIGFFFKIRRCINDYLSKSWVAFRFQGMIVYNPVSYTSNRYSDPCSPNPCGSNTQCRVAEGRPVCSCLPGHWGNPLSYCQRGECEGKHDYKLSQKLLFCLFNHIVVTTSVTNI